MIKITVTKDNDSFLGGLYPAEAVTAAIEYLRNKGYTIVSVEKQQACPIAKSPTPMLSS